MLNKEVAINIIDDLNRQEVLDYVNDGAGVDDNAVAQESDGACHYDLKESAEEGQSRVFKLPTMVDREFHFVHSLLHLLVHVYVHHDASNKPGEALSNRSFNFFSTIPNLWLNVQYINETTEAELKEAD